MHDARHAVRCGTQAALIVDMMRAAGFLEQTGVPGITLGPKLLVGHSLGGACSVANSASIAGVLGAAVMAPAVRPSQHLSSHFIFVAVLKMSLYVLRLVCPY